jgi:hypothetical protein
MAETFLFNVPAADPLTEEAAVFVNLYESIDGLTDWTFVEIVLISTLTNAPNGKIQWTSALSDNTKFHMLVSVSEGGQESISKTILPPRGVGDTTVVFLNTKDILGEAAFGIAVLVQLSGSSVNIGGSLTSLEEHEFITNVEGYVSFTVLRGIKLLITCDLIGKRARMIDTTDKVSINLAELP